MAPVVVGVTTDAKRKTGSTRIAGAGESELGLEYGRNTKSDRGDSGRDLEWVAACEPVASRWQLLRAWWTFVAGDAVCLAIADGIFTGVAVAVVVRVSDCCRTGACDRGSAQGRSESNSATKIGRASCRERV